MIDQERGEYPSASAAERNTYCAGSHALCLVAPPSREIPVTGRGILLHELLSQSGEISFEGFDDGEQWVIEQCVYIKQSIQAHFDFDDAKVITEERLFYVGTKNKIRFSGRLDLLAVDEKNCAALIIDYKTGWKGGAEAARNLQLRWQAVLVHRNFNVTKIYVALVQPMVSELPYSIAAYDDTMLKRARKSVLRAVTATEERDVPRVPGPVQCENCDAASMCPEAHVVVKRIPHFDFRHLQGARAMQFIDACNTAGKIIEASKHYFSEILSRDETAFPGYVSATKNTPYILAEDNVKVFQMFKDHIDAETFTKKMVKLSLKNMIDTIWKSSGWSRKRAKEFVEEKLGEILKHKESNPFMRMVQAKADREKLALAFDPNYNK